MRVCKQKMVRVKVIFEKRDEDHLCRSPNAYQHFNAIKSKMPTNHWRRSRPCSECGFEPHPINVRDNM